MPSLGKKTILQVQMTIPLFFGLGRKGGSDQFRQMMRPSYTYLDARC